MWGTAMANHGCHPAPHETICDGEHGHAHDLCDSFCMVTQCTEHHGDDHGDDHHSGDSYGHKSSGGDHSGNDGHGDCGDDHHSGDSYGHKSSGGDHSGGDHSGDDGHGDCHQQSDCDRTQHDFEHETGRPLPCQITCPCTTQFPLFASLANGSTTVMSCVSDPTIISLLTPLGTFAIVNNGAVPPFCDVNGVAPFLTLTAAEVTACRDLLNQVATAQNVVCMIPE
jgi:hypothetical protein